jgi:hypothetical protein
MTQTTIQTADFTKWLTTLLTETFGVSDSPHSYMLDDGKSGLIGAITQLSAETASTSRNADHNPIASHCGHVLFLLEIYNAFARGETPEIDWEKSWKVGKVNEQEWDKLRGDLQREFDALITGIPASDQWPEPRLSASLIILAHCAYHVGEVRQLLAWVAS